MEKSKLPSCCQPKKEYGGNNPLVGIVYGIIPHIGCIMFIIGAVLGTTLLMQFFRPVLMNRYIFHYLILASVVFATVSSFFYLRKNGMLSKEGVKSKKKYLSVMYGSTVGINLLLFFLVFPLIAGATGGVDDADVLGSSIFNIKVDIPCPGHAPLITNELKTINGVKGSEYSFPNKFEVYYDGDLTSEEDILSLEVFEEYPATVISSENVEKTIVDKGYVKEGAAPVNSAGSCSGGCGGTGSCGGTCGSPSCNYVK